MAIINGLYIHVTGENVSGGVDATSHPVEDGIPTTDLVRPQALAFSLTGKIVDYDGMYANQVISKLRSWQEKGSLITYSGRNVSTNLQIRSFDTDHNGSIHGGADFSMELVKVRIAKSAYVPKKEAVVEQETAAVKQLKESDIKVGSMVIFKGGGVYYSSTREKASYTSGRSTCECTQIAKASAPHRYHLISKDGDRVYGWVDFANIEGVVSTSTSGKTNAGTQQTKTTTSSTSAEKYPVYHKVKSGDTVYNLVKNKYSYLGKSVSWVINQNPAAFSKPGDATTLKTGAYLLMGYKS